MKGDQSFRLVFLFGLGLAAYIGAVLALIRVRA